MPKSAGIGYGQFTAAKVELFSIIIKYHMLITQAVLQKHSNIYQPYYHYIDLTSGCGYTPNGLKGCAIAFVEQAESADITIPCNADFIECEQSHIENLQQILNQRKIENGWKNTCFNFHTGKYQELIPLIVNSRNNDFGIAFIDHSGNMPDFETLKYISMKRPKMEILIYLPSTNLKRIHQYTGKKLSDYLSTIPKKSWLIRKPERSDRHKWTFLLGTNAKDLFRDYPSIKFYKIESKKGQDILKQLNLTAKEQFEDSQPTLFSNDENKI